MVLERTTQISWQPALSVLQSYQINRSIFTTKGDLDPLYKRERLLFDGHFNANKFQAGHFSQVHRVRVKRKEEKGTGGSRVIKQITGDKQNGLYGS